MKKFIKRTLIFIAILWAISWVAGFILMFSGDAGKTIYSIMHPHEARLARIVNSCNEVSVNDHAEVLSLRGEKFAQLFSAEMCIAKNTTDKQYSQYLEAIFENDSVTATRAYAALMASYPLGYNLFEKLPDSKACILDRVYCQHNAPCRRRCNTLIINE